MAFFSITDKIHDITLGKFASPETALVSAITEGRKAGHGAFKIIFDGPYRVSVYYADDTLLFTIQPVETGNRPGPKPKDRAAEQPKSKKLTFKGQPPLDGWYRASSVCELALGIPEMRKVLGNANDGDYALALLTEDMQLDTCTIMGNFLAEARQLLATMTNGKSVNTADLAKEYAMRVLSSGVTDATIVAAYIVQAAKPSRKAFSMAPSTEAEPHGWKPICKRLTRG